jgi:hypothetical protein
MRNKKLTKHHLKPTSLGGTDDPSNIAWIPNIKHRGWHAIVSNLSVPEIVDVLNRHYIDPDYMLVAIKKATP